MNLTSKDISDDFSNLKENLSKQCICFSNASQSIEVMREFLITYNSIGPDSKESESFC